MPDPKRPLPPLTLGTVSFVAAFVITSSVLYVVLALFRSNAATAYCLIVSIPFALAFGSLVGFGASRDVLYKRRRAAGQCVRCGYDLRESPGRCPECGRPRWLFRRR